MSLETTVFTFKISVPFEEWAAVYDSQENIQMNKERGIVCLYKGIKKDDPTSVILIEQGEEGKSIACLLYTSPSPRDATLSRMPSSA